LISAPIRTHLAILFIGLFFVAVTFVDYHRTAPVAFIIMDPWTDHPDERWEAAAKQNMWIYLVPAIAKARKQGKLIIYCTNGHPIDPIVAAHLGDLIITDHEERGQRMLNLYLRSHGVKKIEYAGYAANMCVLTRPTGMLAMRRLYGYEVSLISEATIIYPAGP